MKYTIGILCFVIYNLDTTCTFLNIRTPNSKRSCQRVSQSYPIVVGLYCILLFTLLKTNHFVRFWETPICQITLSACFHHWQLVRPQGIRNKARRFRQKESVFFRAGRAIFTVALNPICASCSSFIVQPWAILCATSAPPPPPKQEVHFRSHDW